MYLRMVIVDTDVLISSMRSNKIAEQLIKRHMPHVNISVVTEVELYIGATNKPRKDAIAKVLLTHNVIPIKAICELAIRLVKTYNTANKSLYLPDAFIAATCLHEHCRLLTFNVKDFKFIKGLQIAM
jgi:tRNA(fMet)-specific endonuclease VapC